MKVSIRVLTLITQFPVFETTSNTICNGTPKGLSCTINCDDVKLHGYNNLGMDVNV